MSDPSVELSAYQSAFRTVLQEYQDYFPVTQRLQSRLRDDAAELGSQEGWDIATVRGVAAWVDDIHNVFRFLKVSQAMGSRHRQATVNRQPMLMAATCVRRGRNLPATPRCSAHTRPEGAASAHTEYPALLVGRPLQDITTPGPYGCGQPANSRFASPRCEADGRWARSSGRVGLVVL